MTEEEKRDIKARLLLECHEAKETVSLLETKALSIAEVLEKGADLLRRHPEKIDARDNPEFPAYSHIFELAQQIKKAKAHLAEKRAAAQQLGLSAQ